MKSLFFLVALSSFIFLLDTASAQASAIGVQQGLSTFAGLITTFNNTVVKALATLCVSGAVVAFFFGVTQFIWGLRQGKGDAITNGKQFMIWGLVALFVMFSVYGIIKVTQSLVPGLDSTTITIPNVNYGGSGLGSPTTGGGNGQNTSNPNNPLQPTVFTCPDGVTKYYDQSDYKMACTKGSTGGAPSSSGVLQPEFFTCPDGVTKYYDQSDYKFVCR